jgi:cytochrome c oxidase subunit II
MQPAFSPMKQEIIDLHNLVLIMITLITLFVAGLLVWVCIRYNEKRNPVPSQTSHNTTIEILWTVLPVLILVIMAIPSFRLIYYLDRTPNPDMTIKVTGHQWYWEYSYPDDGNVDVESRYIHDEDLKPGQLRLLAVDNELVIPAGKKIRVLTNSVTPFRAARSSCGWRPTSRGCIMASAIRSAARTTVRCRSRCTR